jgi:hypothetical protein
LEGLVGEQPLIILQPYKGESLALKGDCMKAVEQGKDEGTICKDHRKSECGQYKHIRFDQRGVSILHR